MAKMMALKEGGTGYTDSERRDEAAKAALEMASLFPDEGEEGDDGDGE